MTRGLGLTQWLADVLEAAEPFFALLTQLGDTWLLAVLAVSLYGLGAVAPLPGWDRRRGAAVLAVMLLAIAATGLLKSAVALPRPPGAGEPTYRVGRVLGDLYDEAATGDGYGFPSGHAVGATAVYGTVAALLPPTARRRAALAGSGLVVAVVVSRLVLGLHYLVDVVAGVALGLVLVALASRWIARPVVTFAIAVPAAAGWAVVTNGEQAAIGTVGLCAGALLAWARFDDRLTAISVPRRRWIPVVVASLTVGVVTLATIHLADRPVAAIAGLLGMAGIVALPLAAR